MADVKVTEDVEMTGTSAPSAEASTSTETKSAQPVVFNEPLPILDGKSPEEVQKLLSGAAKQINFYFSDANLPIDKYLFSLTCCNEPLYGWVPIQTLVSFARMRDPYQGLGVPFVAYALRQHIAAAGPDPLLAVSEDGENVRRAKLMERDSNGAWSRSVYVKGFGEDKEGQDTQSKILEYFEKFGDINSVRLRRADKEGAGPGGKGKGSFKGSVFTEFATQEAANAFLALESIPKFVPEGEEMIKMSKQQYVDMKTEERKAKGLPVDIIRHGKPDLPSGTGASESKEGETKEDKSAEQKQSGSQGKNAGAKGGKFPDKGKFSDKFNAFRELERMRKGLPGNLAVIPDGVAVVGKAIPVDINSLKRRREGEDVDDRNAKRQQTSEVSFRVLEIYPEADDQPFEIEYLGTSLKCDRLTGKVLEPSRIPFQEKSAIKFSGAGEGADWKDLKVQIMGPGGIKEPFLAAPPKEKGGRLAKKDNSSFTEAEFNTLRDAKLTYGGVEVTWEHMTSTELQDFWAVRASFQGGVVAKKLKDAQDAKNEELAKKAAQTNAKDVGKHHGGGRGGRGGRGGGGRGGGRGRGGRGGGRGGDRNREKGNDSGMPPALASGGGD